ncbi:MAG: alpha/beta hydrolase [Candidatus Omnitrophica bacterium]|nr:alpha/beta hydrolase [Candidatus Omnitrophota bacterium]
MRKRKFLLTALLLLFLNLPLNSHSSERRVSSGALLARDNVEIAYEHYKTGSNSVVIVCPGFFNSKDNRWMRKTVDLISAEYDVIIFDFRGHGKSGGKFTWSAKEDRDVDAVLDYAKKEGYKHIGVVAFSLGAASAVNAASRRDDVESMVLISCPTKFKSTNFHFWEPEMFYDLKDNIECGWEGKGARVANIFIPKEKPIKTIGRMKNTAILFIHGDRDWVVKENHSKKLYDAFSGKKDIEIIKGGLHAERLIQFHPDRMRELILDWFRETLK